jgi:hypothetical protein
MGKSRKYIKNGNIYILPIAGINHILVKKIISTYKIVCNILAFLLINVKK